MPRLRSMLPIAMRHLTNSTLRPSPAFLFPSSLPSNLPHRHHSLHNNALPRRPNHLHHSHLQHFFSTPKHMHTLSNPIHNNSNTNAAASSTPTVIEVERKFTLTPDVKRRLLARTSSSTPLTPITIVDHYYNENLAVTDNWLRLRNGLWELKLPLHSSSPSPTTTRCNGAVVYRELSGDDVWLHLQRPPPNVETSSSSPSSSDTDIDTPSPSTDEEDDGDMTCFASLTTHRLLFSLPSHPFTVNVTLDECLSDDGFQCSIGELEVLVNDEQAIAPATEALQTLSGELSLQQLHDNEGKLVKYIRLFRPSLHKKLVAVGIQK